jgi:4-hydroxybenzoate polyprenyltransferase
MPFLQLIRLHHYVKNLLIFIPLFLSHSTDEASITNSLLGFLSFCLMASSIYIINDFLDLEHDKKHPIKCMRPLACGKISPSFALITAIVLALISISTAIIFLNKYFIILLFIYAILSNSYSFFLKRLALLDIFTLTCLYLLRIIAGVVLTEATLSNWLLAFSTFLFLCLASVKRQTELFCLRSRGDKKISGRDYEVSDLPFLQAFSIATAVASVMILALYINSSDIKRLYNKPEILWLICPLLLFWLTRILFLTERGQMHSDPIVFALKDKSSFLIAALTAIILAISVFY